MKKYKVKSIFGPTIQGEGSTTGTVVKFLRLVGCNRWTGLEKDRSKAVCFFCDTDFRDGTSMSALEIATDLNELGPVRRVVISGGEPTLQMDRELLLELKHDGYEIYLETNGSSALGDLHNLIDHITMSPKQPIEQTKLEKCDDLKILYPPILKEVTVENFLKFPAKQRYVQPVWDSKYELHLKETLNCLYGHPNWMLSIQTHKIIGVD